MNVPESRELGLFAAWIGVLLLIGGLALFFSAPLRSRRLTAEVDSFLAESKDGRRLAAAEPTWGSSGRASLGTLRYSVQKSDAVAVLVPHTLHGLGAFFLYLLSPEGGVEGPIPLSDHSRRVLERMPAGLLRIYRERVRASDAWLKEREK